MQFGKLKNLQVLDTFFVDRNSELSTKQLGVLGGLNLHGRCNNQSSDIDVRDRHRTLPTEGEIGRRWFEQLYWAT